MNTRQAYDRWSSQYDTDANKTRDLEATAIRATLARIPFHNCLEIGCGTGKNTEWLALRAGQVTAVDLSTEMMEKAKEKNLSGHVQFVQGDITGAWHFGEGRYDLVSFSLVLEHIEDLGHVFANAAKALGPGGHVYLGELHPFKQYTGSKARFDTAEGRHMVPCFNHHLSDFSHEARRHGLQLEEVAEFFDGDDRTAIPRILVMIFKKP